jgi:haloacid dehalogenase-like hydrolase
MRRLNFCLLVVLVLASGFALADDLPSWNETPVKAAILEYLETVTTTGNPDFIPVVERVAVFDNDGTFWCERPEYPSTLFQAHLVRRLAAQNVIDGNKMPFKAWIAYDKKALGKYGWKESYREMISAFGGMPVAAFQDSARAFMDRSKHPKYQVPFAELYYAPMLELADLLKAHEFQLWVVTGSEQDFMRSFLEDATGVPPERVIGSWTPAISTEEGKEIKIVRGTEQVYNGHEAKPGNIETRIGRRPVFCVGNSNNDQPMCRYTVTGDRRGLALWVLHDDSGREYKYDKGTDRMADLVEESGDAWLISMKKDWNRLYKNGIGN